MGKQRMQTNFHFIVISVNWFGITTITTRSMCLELGHQKDRDRGRPSEIKQSPRWKKIRHLFSLHQSLTDWQRQKGTLTVIDYKTCLDFSCSNNLPSITINHTYDKLSSVRWSISYIIDTHFKTFGKISQEAECIQKWWQSKVLKHLYEEFAYFPRIHSQGSGLGIHEAID